MCWLDDDIGRDPRVTELSRLVEAELPDAVCARDSARSESLLDETQLEAAFSEHASRWRHRICPWRHLLDDSDDVGPDRRERCLVGQPLEERRSLALSSEQNRIKFLL